ncbi:MAG: DUF3108 domain-containing protein [Alphaproteobacteria bacterium]|nr:DUF3108 domain-containing protein [Alphaproteobacteria bacterium]
MSTAILLRAAVLTLVALPASAESLTARYEIYTGGFKSLAVQARAAIDDGTYRVEANLNTTGMIDWILRYSQKVEGEGETAGTASANPLRYVADGTFFGTHRRSRVDYQRDGGVTTTLHPANEDDDRTPVPETLKRGTLDPLSVFIALNRTASGNAGPCHGKVPVYDGRRRYDLVIEDDGVSAVEKTQYSVFSGPVLRCKIHMERLAGFQRNPRFNNQPPRVSIVYLARFGERGWWLPVRLESESGFGNVVGHLVEVDAPARPLGRGTRPAS